MSTLDVIPFFREFAAMNRLAFSTIVVFLLIGHSKAVTAQVTALDEWGSFDFVIVC